MTERKVTDKQERSNIKKNLIQLVIIDAVLKRLELKLYYSGIILINNVINISWPKNELRGEIILSNSFIILN